MKNGPAEIYKNLDHGSRNKLQLQEAGEYKSDLKQGAWKIYSPDGKVKIMGQYDKDQPSGDWKLFSSSGETLKAGTFEEVNIYSKKADTETRIASEKTKLELEKKAA